MDEEMQAMIKNDTCELIYFPQIYNVFGITWVYKTKRNAKGKVEKYKERLVAKGSTQKQGIDYDEVFALIAHLEVACLIIFLIAQNK